MTSGLDPVQELADFKEDMKRRFRWAMIGYIVLVIACAAGVFVNYNQQRDLQKQQNTTVGQVCLQILAKSDQERVAQLELLAKTGKVDFTHNEICKAVVKAVENH